MNGRTIFVASLISLALLAPVSVQAEKIETKPFIKGSPTDMGTCAITVQFFSFADGIDDRALTLVEHYAEANSDVTSPRLYPWGMEGEKTLCLNTTSSDKTSAVFAAIKSILPPKPLLGRITLMMGEESYSVPGLPTPPPAK